MALVLYQQRFTQAELLAIRANPHKEVWDRVEQIRQLTNSAQQSNTLVQSLQQTVRMQTERIAQLEESAMEQQVVASGHCTEIGALKAKVTMHEDRILADGEQRHELEASIARLQEEKDQQEEQVRKGLQLLSERDSQIEELETSIEDHEGVIRIRNAMIRRKRERIDDLDTSFQALLEAKQQAEAERDMQIAEQRQLINQLDPRPEQLTINVEGHISEKTFPNGDCVVLCVRLVNTDLLVVKACLRLIHDRREALFKYFSLDFEQNPEVDPLRIGLSLVSGWEVHFDDAPDTLLIFPDRTGRALRLTEPTTDGHIEWNAAERSRRAENLYYQRPRRAAILRARHD